MREIPSIDSDVYVPTIGEYFIGGLAKITGIVEGYVLVEEHSGASYLWKDGLDNMQESLKNQFGNQRAYSTGVIPPCPL